MNQIIIHRCAWCQKYHGAKTIQRIEFKGDASGMIGNGNTEIIVTDGCCLECKEKVLGELNNE